MAHLAHALPWNTLASNFKYKQTYTHNPQRKDIFAAEKANQAKEIDHFCRVFAAKIQEFAATERAKFISRAEFQKRAQKPDPGKVYPDEILNRYFSEDCEDGHVDKWLRQLSQFWGREKLQRIDSWVGDIYGSRCEHGDTLKIMMMEAAGTAPAITAGPSSANEDLKKRVMESMLTLTNNPKVDVLSLVNMHHGHHFGLSRVAEEGIRAYLYLNLLVALQEGGSDVCDYVRGDESGVEDRSRRQYMGLRSYTSMLGSVAGTYDGDAQNLVHWDFFYNRAGGGGYEFGESKDVLADVEALKEYLKGVWRVLVVYDLVIREAGGDPSLEMECRTALNLTFDLRLDLSKYPS